MSDDPFDEFDDELGDEFEIEDEGVDEALLEEFEKNVDRKMRVLISKRSVEERVEAAYWLGNSGSPKAIMALRKVYRLEKKTKKNKNLLQATQFALGQFKALDEAIERGPGESVSEALGQEENADVLQLLTDIAIKGKTGKPKRVSASALSRVMIGLVVSLIVFMALTMILAGNDGETDPGGDVGQSDANTTATAMALAAGPTAAAAGDTPEAVLEQLQTSLETVRTTALMLQAQLSAVEEGDVLSCDVSLVVPEAVAVNAQVAATAPVVSELSSSALGLINNLQILVDAYSEFCQDSTVTPDQTNLELVTSSLDRLLRDLDPVQEDVATQIELINNPPTPTPDVTATPTIEPTATVTPVDQRAVESSLTILTRNIDTVLVGRSAYPLLSQYWNDVRTNGSTGGCNNTRPQIPEDYTVPAELTDAMPELMEIAQQTNIGLQMMRDAWDYFEGGCRDGNLDELVDSGVNQLATAQSLLNAARTSITEIRNGE